MFETEHQSQPSLCTETNTRGHRRKVFIFFQEAVLKVAQETIHLKTFSQSLNLQDKKTFPPSIAEQFSFQASFFTLANVLSTLSGCH